MKITTEILHKEIDLIQACITRMAYNSFLIKGWTISIVAVVLALADKTNNSIFLSTVLLIPLLSFWYLDAFFLRTEQMYRKMYTWVLEKRKNDDDEMLYDLNPVRFIDDVDSIPKTMQSITLRCFYGIPVLIVLGIISYQALLSPSLSKNHKSPHQPFYKKTVCQPAEVYNLQTNTSKHAEHIHY